MLEQLKAGFKITINRNKYQSKISTEKPNQHLDLIIDQSFQAVNRLSVLSFENNAHRTSYKRYFFPTVEMKDCNVMINEQNLFDQPVENNLRVHDSIRKIATGQWDDYTTGCLLDCNYFKNYYKMICNYFKNYYKMIAIDLSKQQALAADPKAILQINWDEDEVQIEMKMQVMMQ